MVDLESADEGIVAKKSPCDEINEGNALSIAATAGPMVNTNVGATEGDQLGTKPGVLTLPSPRAASAVKPFALTPPSSGKATTIVRSSRGSPFVALPPCW